MSIESEFIKQVVEICGTPFLALVTEIDMLKISDFAKGRAKPRPIDMTRIIDAQGLFVRLTAREVAA